MQYFVISKCRLLFIKIFMVERAPEFIILIWVSGFFAKRDRTLPAAFIISKSLSLYIRGTIVVIKKAFSHTLI